MTEKTLAAQVLDERVELTIVDLCQTCAVSTDWVVELVDEGVLEPVGRNRESWRFTGSTIARAHMAMRLQKDLQLNTAGVALALELIEQLRAMRERLNRLEAQERA